jgi:hypothetical protein
MILDLQNLFSNAQAVTSSAASTNIIDLGAANTMPAHYGTLRHAFFTGNQPEVFVQVVTSFTTSDAATLTVTLQSHDDDSFGATTSLVLAPLSGTFSAATLVAGYHCRFPIHVPAGWNDQYLRLYYTVGTGTFTAGAITAGFRLNGENNPWTKAEMI